MIALILGTETDWCRNIRAAGGCTLQVGRISYALTGPQLVDQAAALPAFPVSIRLVARVVGIRHFLRLRATGEAQSQQCAANHSGQPIGLDDSGHADALGGEGPLERVQR
jgi:hypothetical protein